MIAAANAPTGPTKATARTKQTKPAEICSAPSHIEAPRKLPRAPAVSANVSGARRSSCGETARMGTQPASNARATAIAARRCVGATVTGKPYDLPATVAAMRDRQSPLTIGHHLMRKVPPVAAITLIAAIMMGNMSALRLDIWTSGGGERAATVAQPNARGNQCGRTYASGRLGRPEMPKFPAWKLNIRPFVRRAIDGRPGICTAARRPLVHHNVTGSATRGDRPKAPRPH